VSWRRAHPSTRLMSELLDDGLNLRERADLHAHLRTCEECRATFESLSTTVTALNELRTSPPPRFAESVVAATPPPSGARRARRNGLQVVGGGGRPGRARGAYRVWRSRVRALAAIAVAIGVPVTAVNQGGMFLSGQFDVLGVCECALNFVVPFVVLSVAAVFAAPGRWQRGA
jgi:anti-sigma factor RsiW